MKVWGGSRSKALCVLNLGTKWRSMVSFILQPLYRQGKSLRLSGPQSQSQHDGKEKNTFPARNQTSVVQSIITIITLLTALSQVVFTYPYCSVTENITTSK
jgi:hypothetical protein